MEDPNTELLVNTKDKCNTIKHCSKDSTPLKKNKYFINWLKMCGINLLPFGLELCACAGFTYIPPLMLKSGFTDRSVTIIMGIGPFISLIVVPLLGKWSDNCRSRFGRRRPFLLALGLMMVVSLLIIPFGNENFFGSNNLTAIGVILLDFSNQALMNPCKALIPDVLHSLEEQNAAFSVYSFMLSMGGCVGYCITSINWESTHFGQYFYSQENTVFFLLAASFLILLILNLVLSIERPMGTNESLILNPSHDNSTECTVIESDSEINIESFSSNSPLVFNGFGSFPVKTSKINIHKKYKFFQFLSINSSVRSIKMGFKRILCFLFFPINIILKCLLETFSIPSLLLQLFIACLFGWMGIMCHDMYYSDFVGQVIYQGKPHDLIESSRVMLYNKGVRMGSLGLLLQCFIAAIYGGFVQDFIIKIVGRRCTYIFGMFSFTMCLFGTVLSKNIIIVNAFAALSGFGLGAITTMPYSLVNEYAAKDPHSKAKKRGMCEDMAIVDSAFYLSQILLSLFLGYVAEWIGSPLSYMVVATSCGAAATYVSFFVVYHM